MSQPGTAHLVSHVDAADYEPMTVDGVQVGEICPLRSEGSHGNHHEACLWRTDAPATYDYFFEGDESFQVLEGSVSIEIVDTGERLELKVGDLASFPKGIRSIWTFTEPFKKFTVISD